MTRDELDELLEKLEVEYGLKCEYGESFEGVQYICFEVDEDEDEENDDEDEDG
jgi:hypothetical protein